MKARLAPTPSGYLHQGNATNFALNALLAAEGALLLRIDDLDRARFRPEYLEDIFRVIDWLGIQVTEGPQDAADFAAHWSQDRRMPAYHAALTQLRESPLVFACPCTRKVLASGQHAHRCKERRIDLATPGVAWRLDTARLAENIRIPDRIRANGFTLSLAAVIPDVILRKKDGRPSYQLACTVDDYLLGITQVGRGEDLLPSTAVQAVLSDLLGYPPLFERIEFVHHPLLLDPKGGKLSKSSGAAGISSLRETVHPAMIFAQAKEWLTGKTYP